MTAALSRPVLLDFQVGPKRGIVLQYEADKGTNKAANKQKVGNKDCRLPFQCHSCAAAARPVPWLPQGTLPLGRTIPPGCDAERTL